MIRTRHTIAPIALLGLGALVTACGTKTIDPKPVETQISTSAGVKAAGWVATEAHCPSGQKAKAGTTFICTVKFNGVQVSFKATVDSVGSSQAHITTQETDPIIDVKKFADGVATAAGAGVTVDCGPPIQQLKVGTEVTCTAKSGTDTQTLKVKVDSSGALSPETTTGDTTTTVPSGATSSGDTTAPTDTTPPSTTP